MLTKLPLAVALATLLTLPIFAQTDQARFAGTVTDATGAVVSGAIVAAKSSKTGAERTATTGASGQYVITNLLPAEYSLTAKSAGLSTHEAQKLRLEIGEVRTVNLILQAEGVSQTIEVTSGLLAEVDTSSARVGVNVSEREVGNLPLNGRQLSQLYLLAPGATTAGGGTFDNIRFSGRANQQNAVRYDGVEGSAIIDSSPGNLNGQISSFFRLQASLENVQEFRVESNNYPAEYGTGTGGQISVVTKSGSNELHCACPLG